MRRDALARNAGVGMPRGVGAEEAPIVPGSVPDSVSDSGPESGPEPVPERGPERRPGREPPA